jgi:hypothetical protein
MSRDGSIELYWPDERRTYRLRIGELRQLQEKCDKGPLEIIHALAEGKWRVDDVIQPIRLGLIGGGMKLEDANKLVEATVHDGTLGEAIFMAKRIVECAIMGPPDEQIEMPGSGSGKSKASKAGSASSPSTAKGPASDGRRSKSTH